MITALTTVLVIAFFASIAATVAANVASVRAYA
jgi:hypothetical protein